MALPPLMDRNINHGALSDPGAPGTIAKSRLSFQEIQLKELLTVLLVMHNTMPKNSLAGKECSILT
jgi:hypothetical protein